MLSMITQSFRFLQVVGDYYSFNNQKLQRNRNSTVDGSTGDLDFGDFAHIPYEGGIKLSLNARDRVLRRCNQSDPLEFSIVYAENVLRQCRKLGEGVYDEVCMNKTVRGEAIVLKIIPIEDSIEVNGEPPKRFDEFLSEIVIAMELSRLRDDKEFMTSGFVEVKGGCCGQGRYPEQLIDLWELYRDNCGPENDHPEIFRNDQLYIGLELAKVGQDLEAVTFRNALQAYSAFLQASLSLGVAEQKFLFELATCTGAIFGWRASKRLGFYRACTGFPRVMSIMSVDLIASMKLIYITCSLIILWIKTHAKYAGNISYLKGKLVHPCGSRDVFQCHVVLLHLNPPTFIGSGLCLFDEWGNYSPDPKSYRIDTSLVSLDVTKIFLHPKFISGQPGENSKYCTMFNIAQFRVRMRDEMLKKYEKHQLEDQYFNDDAINCAIHFVDMPSVVKQNPFLARFVNHSQYCSQEMFPMSFGLPADDVCAKVPIEGYHSLLARHFTGAAVICSSYDQYGSSSVLSENEYSYLYAIWTSTYRCGNRDDIPVFTRIAYHSEFFRDPENYTLVEKGQFRWGTQSKKNKSSQNVRRSVAVYSITLMVSHFILTN